MVSHVSLLLDTNIISELVKVEPNTHVFQQFQTYKNEIAIPSLVWHELRFGWLRMPDSKRKQSIGLFLHDVVSLLPILPYDTAAAKIHAEIRVEAQKTGHTLPFADGQIAAIAMSQGLSLVTRNTKDFETITGLRLINWFE
ncbi:type II toxin-antitoxin system VapC family toxin [Alkanindiges sp. WGS2144]|uniref:type II toxin-antitoxin system VapC family toxin n=1 Tax=Alkanindiges sp. WGS2144 TaxID=3366808 RepID=UPI003753C216